VNALVALATFVAMEPVSYATHRWVMHGAGMGLHRSHHCSAGGGGVEGNDWFPVLFSTMGMLCFATGASVGSLSLLVPVSLGAAAYGCAYVLVHDVYIHRRLRWFTAELALGERLKAAHRVHHLFGGEPYGMLVPIVPSALRARAAAVAYDPLPPARSLAVARGSTPSHVPVER
jgi:beta-carotene 3-hydroxylase